MRVKIERILTGAGIVAVSGLLFGSATFAEASCHKLYQEIEFREESVSFHNELTVKPNGLFTIGGLVLSGENSANRTEAGADAFGDSADGKETEENLVLQSERIVGTQAMAKVTNFVNVRVQPSTSAAVAGKLYADCVGTVLEDCGEWVCIESGNLKGYVVKEFLYLGSDAKVQIARKYQPKVKITANVLNVRAAADTSAAVLGEYGNGKTVDFLEFCGDWVKIRFSEEKDGYVYGQYVSVSGLPACGETLAEESDRLAAEAAKKAEEERLAAEAAKKAEEERLAAEAAKKAEEERLAAEAAKKAEEERLAAEAAKKAEEERLAAEAAKKAEEERLAAEAAKKAEEERLAAEAAKAENELMTEEERQAAEEAAKAEAEKKAEEERLAAEAAKKAEEERLAAEAAKKAEEERLAAEEAARIEAEKKAEEERIEAEKQATIDLVISYAMSALGKPYIWGGNDLTKGTDCSGLCYASYLKVGIKLQRVSRDMAKDSSLLSVKADEEHLKPGDLVFYHNVSTGVVDHVAMYIGDGKIIHASGYKDGITISNYKYRPPHSAKRVIQ